MGSRSSSRSSSCSDKSDCNRSHRKNKHEKHGHDSHFRLGHHTSSPPPYSALHYPHSPGHNYMAIHSSESREQPIHPIPHGGSAHGPGGIPPQGRRFQTSTTAPFPGVEVTGPPPFSDVGGEPVFVGSCVFERSVHPCKLAPHLRPVCRVGYGGGEDAHEGR